MMHRFTYISLKILYLLIALVGLFLLSAHAASAATLSLSPGTGVYTSGSTFTVNVRVNTQGEEINAAEGTLKFNPNELSVVNVSRASSIFNLWVAEPAFSNSTGNITFSGGSPSGYSGGGGTVMSVTFRAAGAGSARVSFTNGSVLANDGRGTNVLTNMGGGTFTIQAQSSSPAPEVITEYVAPDMSGINQQLAVQAETVASLKEDVQQQFETVTALLDNMQEDLDRVREDADEVDTFVRTIDEATNETQRDLRNDVYGMETELNDRLRELDSELREMRDDLEEKIERILDNPLNDSE